VPLQITPEQAREVLRDRGHDPRDITGLRGGAWSTVFAFREEGRDYVVRFHDRRDDLEKDRFAERWASARLRTPKIVEIGDMPKGAYGISERVRGGPIDDLDEAGMRRVLPELFGAMDAMREADLAGTRGYGLWHGDGVGIHATWRDALVGESSPGERAAQREMLARGPIGSMEFDAGLRRMHELLTFLPEERHLVHNDLLYRNVIVDESGGLVLLDWGASIFGDFVYDAALLTIWWPWYAKRWGGIDIRSEIEKHYDRIGLRVPGFRERLRCCEIDIAVSHIAYQASHGEWDSARWTAARTLELVTAPMKPE